MKRKLLLAALFVVSALGFNAKAQTEPVADGVYYLYNKESGKFLSRGSNWGTQGVVNDFGLPWKVAVADGKYKLRMYDIVKGGGTSGLGDNSFTDNGGPIDFTLDGTPEAYKIKFGENFLTVDSNNAINVSGTDGNASVTWQFLNVDDYNEVIKAKKAAQESSIATAAAIDLTGTNLAAVLTSGDFKITDVTSSISATPTNGGEWKHSQVPNRKGNVNYGSYGTEIYQGGGSYTYTKEGLAEGIYKVGIKALFRSTTNATCHAIGTEGYSLSSAYLSANGNTVQIKDWYSSCKSNSNPNSTGEFVSIANNGGYYSEVYTYVGSDGVLSLSVVSESYWGSSWLLFNGVTLTSYSNTMSEAEATEIITKANSLSGPMLNTVQESLASALAKFESSKTIANYNALDIAIANAKASMEKYASANETLEAMMRLMESTNVYTTEAFNTYKQKYDDAKAKYDAKTLTNEEIDVLENPEKVLNWKEANSYDDFLLSAWGTNNFDTDLYINTWSIEGEGDGSNFKVPFFEYWTGDANSLATTTKTATVVGLESEQLYTVSAWVRVRAKNGQTDPHGITLSVGDGTPTDVTKGSRIGDTQFYIAEVTAVGKTNAEGTLTINFNVAEDNNISWLSYKNVKYNSGTDTDLLLVAYNSALAAANEAAAKDMLPSVKEILETVIAENSNVDNTDPDALTAATAALNEAVKNATPSIKSYEVLANGVPNNSLDGWTCTNTNAFQVNTWSIEADNTGMVTPFIENWVGKETILGEGQFYYTMKDIAPGSYCVSALIRVYSESGSEPSGAAFFVGDQTVDITTGESFEYNGMKGVYDNYSAIATVGEDGVLKFGVDIKAERTFNWVAIKNVVVKEYHTTSNLDFSESTPIDNHICTYAKDMATNGTTYSQMQPVTSWDMAVENGDARAAGVFAYGGTSWLGGAGYPAPATNPEGVAEGNALGLIAVWSATVQYTQPVTLLPGNYVLTVPVYNTGAGKNNMAKNLIGFIAEDGTEYLASAKVYPSNTWTPETITFTLDKVTNGVLSLGYQAPNAGNGDQHHLFIDCVKIKVVSELDLAKEELLADIEDAKATVDAKANVGDGLFMIPTADYDTYAAAVVAAQNVYDNATTVADVEAAIATLAAAGETYAGSIALPEADKDYQIIHNASGLFMSLNGGVKIEAAATVKFEAAGDGKYYIANANGEYAYYSGTGDNKWSLNVSAGSKEAWTITAVGDGLYTIKGKNGHIGTDNLTNGSTCYGNKAGDAANSMWLIREAKEVFVEMKISDAKYSTFIAPFEVTIPDGVTASKVTGATDGVLTLEDLEGTIPANTPVVLYSETEYKNQFTGIDLSTKDSYTDGLLTGVYTATNVQLGWYVLQNNSGKVGFYRVDTEAITTVGANRCYLTIPAESEAKAFFFGGEATGISAIEALQNGDAEIYTINGTRVNTLQKGINIVKMSNGKTQKVLVK